MVYTYTPTYYSSLHDSIRFLCKSILPFKRKRLPAADRSTAKLQSDNLKWQQDSFYQMLNLIGLRREGILADHEVSAFRVYLLDTVTASPPNAEHPAILRDKLLFLQELLYAECISQDEYQASKRPLLQRLAVQGAEIESRDVILGGHNVVANGNSEERSVIDLKDENWLLKGSSTSKSKSKSKHNSVLKQVKGAASVFGHVSPYGSSKKKEEKSICRSAAKELYSSSENPFWNVRLKGKESETKRLPSEAIESSTERGTRKPFRTLFLREHREETKGSSEPNMEGKMMKSAKKETKHSKRNDKEDETAPLPLNDLLDSEGYSPLRQPVFSPIARVPNTNQKLHPSSSSSLLHNDKVSAYKNECKVHTGEMEKHSISTQWTTFNDDDIYRQPNISTQWETFDDDDENFHPNLFASQQNSTLLRDREQAIGIANNFRNNPFESAEGNENKSTSAAYSQDYNPFGTISHGPSLVG